MGKNIFSLEGKVSVITGGYGHIGKYLSKALAEFGSKVYIAGKSFRKFKERIGNRENINFIYLDILDSRSIKKAFKEIFKKEGRFDILVNNAVYSVQNTPENISPEEFSAGIDGTLNSVFRCIKYSIPFLKIRGGCIINISSMYGIVSPDLRIYERFPKFLNPPNYGAGKAGVIQLTKYYAVALAKYGIRVNCIIPGAFPSEEVKKEREFISLLEDKIPLGRVGHPKELIGPLILLASEASSYMTGASIIVDGGWTIW